MTFGARSYVAEIGARFGRREEELFGTARELSGWSLGSARRAT